MSNGGVTIEWLKDIVAMLGYDTEVSNGDRLRLRHQQRPNGFLTLDKDQSLIRLISYAGMKPPEATEKKLEQYADLNSANLSASVSTFYLDRDGDVGVYSYMPLTESLSGRDIVSWLDKYNNDFWNGLRDSGLADFMG